MARGGLLQAVKRFRDWQSRLAAFVESRRHEPFAWGTNDCCTFACSAVESMTGHDPAEGLREHRTAAEAAEVIRDNGGIEALACSRLGAEIVTGLAAVGDIGYAECASDRWGLVVCIGEHWTGPGESGLVVLPKGAAVRAWRAI
jgi:hypothetical protein